MIEDDFERLGVYDPGAPHAAERLAMLQHLVGAGVTSEQLARAEQAGDLLAALPDVRLHGTGGRTTIGEVVARSALRPEFVQDAWDAAGLGTPLPDEHLFTQADVSAFGELAGVTDLVGEEAATFFLRALGSAARAAADEAITDLVSRIEGPVERTAFDDARRAEALDTALSVLASVPDLFDVLFRHHALAVLTAYLRDHPARVPES